MAEAFLPIENGELLMPSPSLPDATEQNNIPFDNLLTILQDASQNNASPSSLPMSNRENEKIFSSDVPPSIEGNKKTDPSKGGTNSPAFPAFFSDICNFFSIAGNLLMNIEKDSKQGVMIKGNREETLSYGIESPERNTSLKYPLLQDARVFNATPFLGSITKQEDPVLQAAKGIMPPDDTGSLQGNNIQTDLFETILKPLPGNEIILPHEKYDQVWLTDKKSHYITKEVISKNTFLSFSGSTAESRKTLDARLSQSSQVVRGETSGMTYKDVVCDVANERISKPVQINSFSPKDLQIVSYLKANDDNQINTGFHEDQIMTVHEDRNNGAHILSAELHLLKAFTDTGSSTPLEANAKDELLIQSKVNDTQNYVVLKNGEPKINTVPYATDGDGKNNTGLRDKLHMISPESSSPVLSEEIQSPTTITSLKLPVLSETSPLIEDPPKSEGSGDKGHNQNTSPETIIMQAEDIFPLINNQHSNENSPLRANILQNHPNADVFVLQKKGDASIEVSLEPEGMGKIDIELTLDRGLINAQINTSEIIGKEIIERNLYAILSSLIDEGLNIGSFSVSLRNRQNEMNGNNREETSKTLPAIKPVQTPFALSQNRIISIFV